ncbi:MAG: hypothetical protein Q9170_005205 [Blastenia crenularia]
MLEQQQAQLVNALQELYRRITNKEGWKGDLLDTSASGHPLTHDILERLDALRIDGHVSPDRFEENTEILQQKLLADGAVHIKRQLSPDSDSDEEDAPPKQQIPSPKRSLTGSYIRTSSQLPPTPPLHTPTTFFSDSPTTYGSTDSALPESMQLQIQQQYWNEPAMTYQEGLDFFPTVYDTPIHLHHQSNPCLPTLWAEDDIVHTSYSNNDIKYRARV